MQWNPILMLDELLCTAANGGGVRIGWIAGEAWTGVKLLRSHGVTVWGMGMASNPDRRYCMVRPQQAKWAVSLLSGAGLTVVEGPEAPPVSPASTWGAPAAAQGFIGIVSDLFTGGVRADRRQAKQERRQRRKERYR